MILPPILEPWRYVGLYLYDFGSHVAVGYTAAEVRILRESTEHGEGTAYEIYGVAENGGLELRGVTDDRIGAMETIAFLRADEQAARNDCEVLQAVAAEHPLPCASTLQQVTLDPVHTPHGMLISYPVAASAVLSAWLSDHAVDLGDRVVGGTDAAAMAGAARTTLGPIQLPTQVDFADRPATEVLATVHNGVQR